MDTEKVEQRKEFLGNRELISSVYLNILQRFPHQEIDFQGEPPSSVIADDSDAHRSRIGIMFYDNVSLLTVDNKTWVLALGQRTKNYPADQFSFDLKAFRYEKGAQMESEIREDLRKRVKGNNPKEMSEGYYFQKSLLIGISGRGMVVNNKYGPSARLGDLTRAEFENYVAQKPEVDTHFVNNPGFGPPILEKSIKYKPEYVEVLAQAISEVLSNPSEIIF